MSRTSTEAYGLPPPTPRAVSTSAYLTLCRAAKSLPCTFYTAASAEVTGAECEDWLRGKWLALYFSASWCKPCKSFTPVLAEYLRVHADRIAGVLVPFDEAVDRLRVYAQNLPGAVYMDLDHVRNVAQAFGAQHIPTLIFISPSGVPMDADGLDIVRKSLLPWDIARL